MAQYCIGKLIGKLMNMTICKPIVRNDFGIAVVKVIKSSAKEAVYVILSFHVSYRQFILAAFDT